MGPSVLESTDASCDCPADGPVDWCPVAGPAEDAAPVCPGVDAAAASHRGTPPGAAASPAAVPLAATAGRGPEAARPPGPNCVPGAGGWLGPGGAGTPGGAPRGGSGERVSDVAVTSPGPGEAATGTTAVVRGVTVPVGERRVNQVDQKRRSFVADCAF